MNFKHLMDSAELHLLGSLDLPLANVQPEGRARTLDLVAASDEAREAALVDEVLGRDDEGKGVDVPIVLERFSAGLPVWK